MNDGYKKILLVGLNQNTHIDIKRWARALGHKLDVIPAGKDAIKKVLNTQYDIVITSDLNEDFMDGNTIALAIRNTHGESPTIIGLSDTPGFFEANLFDGIYSFSMGMEDIREIINIKPRAAVI